jgi:hypothetical protein
MPGWLFRACVFSLIGIGSVMAQKYPGTSIPTAPAPAPKYSAPNIQPVSPYPTTPAAPSQDPDAERVARGLPLDPSIRELHDQVPPSIPAVERSLGLHVPTGRVTDLRGRVASPAEIVNALAPR